MTIVLKFQSSFARIDWKLSLIIPLGYPGRKVIGTKHKSFSRYVG